MNADTRADIAAIISTLNYTIGWTHSEHSDVPAEEFVASSRACEEDPCAVLNRATEAIGRLRLRLAELESRPVSAPPTLGSRTTAKPLPWGRTPMEDGQHAEDEPLLVAKQWPTQAEIQANHKRLNTADSPDPLPTAEAGIADESTPETFDVPGLTAAEADDFMHDGGYA